MEQKHFHCRKEKEISEIHTDLRTIKNIVMGNGKEGLVSTVPRLNTSVDTLSMNVVGLERGLKGFLRYQQTMEGMAEGKTKTRKANRWLIGILITVNLALVGGIITLIVRLV